MDNNQIINKLPVHLKDFIIDQHYERYTGQDQAVWRYVMRQNVHYLAKHAHPSYIKGLKKTGIAVDHIPSIEEMNKALGKLGWAAATVDGFIPPSVFMEFQKHKVLVIATDIRSAEQIGYTPAPDIIHEAAGHAPIIADPKYAGYLQLFGEIGSKAFSSKEDYQLYEVIRHLSILKADPNTPAQEIKEAEELLKETGGNMGIPSEMALIRNLHWWTVEYGLIGTLENPKIYGAGLLSSISESKTALSDSVTKLPYTLDAMDYGFDITKPQPQLFVTPGFDHLSDVLNLFASKMALKTGGLDAIMKAVHSGTVATLEYSSGLQVSGIFSDVLIHNGQAVYINTTGPTTLNYNGKMLEGHTKEYHNEGFGSPIGKLKNCMKPVRMLTDTDLELLGISKGRHSVLEFDSGLKVEGSLMQVTRRDGKILLMQFTDCYVTMEGKTLFEPSWGVFDMAVGEKIVSGFSGPADPEDYGLRFDPPAEKTHTIQYSEQEKKLFILYDRLFSMKSKNGNTELYNLWNTFRNENHTDWLFPFELYIKTKDKKLKKEITGYFSEITDKDKRKFIEEGMAVI